MTTKHRLCKWCGTMHLHEDAEMCNRCWELDKRIRSDPVLAARILATTVVANILRDVERETNHVKG